MSLHILASQQACLVCVCVCVCVCVRSRGMSVSSKTAVAEQNEWAGSVCKQLGAQSTSTDSRQSDNDQACARRLLYRHTAPSVVDGWPVQQLSTAWVDGK